MSPAVNSGPRITDVVANLLIAPHRTSLAHHLQSSYSLTASYQLMLMHLPVCPTPSDTCTMER